MLDKTTEAMHAAAHEMKALGADHISVTLSDDDDTPTWCMVAVSNPDRIQQLKDLRKKWDDEDDQD